MDAALGAAMSNIQADLAAMSSRLEIIANTQVEMQSAVDDVRKSLMQSPCTAGGPGTLPARSSRSPFGKRWGTASFEWPRDDVSPDKDAATPMDPIVAAQPSHDVGSLPSCGPTGDDWKRMLTQIFRDGEDAEAEREEQRRLHKSWRGRWRRYITNGTMEERETVLDSIMAVVIVINAIFVGLSSDFHDSSMTWLLGDAVLTAAFLTELVLKIYMKGFRRHFCAENRIMNAMDAGLIITDFLQFAMLLVPASRSSDNLPAASLLRIVRILKLARILRICRTEIFRDLLSMIHGMIGGMRTLLWSIGLFVLVVYTMGLLLREFWGRRQTVISYKFFDSVPRSMLTIFRCSFGDCVVTDGTPLIEHINVEYGSVAAVIWCSIIFVLTIGLFNVISAIFVQTTLTAASKHSDDKRRVRLGDSRLQNTKLYTLIKILLEKWAGGSKTEKKFSEAVEELLTMQIPCEVIDHLVAEQAAVSALFDLDIDQEDHMFLSDILDPDMSGFVSLDEFVDGLRRLRGVPKRSDIVTVDLMVRSIQRQVFEIRSKRAALEERTTTATSNPSTAPPKAGPVDVFIL